MILHIFSAAFVAEEKIISDWKNPQTHRWLKQADHLGHSDWSLGLLDRGFMHRDNAFFASTKTFRTSSICKNCINLEKITQ